MEYKVCFDGRWQGDFDDLDEALEWAREVADTGRLVHVVRATLFRQKLVHVFPEAQFDEGKLLWEGRMGGATSAWQQYPTPPLGR